MIYLTTTNTTLPEWFNLCLEYIWVPIIIPVIVFIIKTINKKLIIVFEITRGTDHNINGFKKLYNDRIDENLRIDVEEILRFVNKNNKSDVSHHLYICKHAGKVVGFTKFMISRQKKCIFVAYIAIDKTDTIAMECGVKKMLGKMIRKYFNPKHATKIVTEIQQGKKGEYNTSLAKIISRYAKTYNVKAYYIDAPYIQPNMPGEESYVTSEDLMSLIYIPYHCLENNILSKRSVITLIEFIYFDIYGPSCNEVFCDCIAYNRYLSELVNMYQSDFEDYIKLIPLGGT